MYQMFKSFHKSKKKKARLHKANRRVKGEEFSQAFSSPLRKMVLVVRKPYGEVQQ